MNPYLPALVLSAVADQHAEREKQVRRAAWKARRTGQEPQRRDPDAVAYAMATGVSYGTALRDLAEGYAQYLDGSQ